MSHLSLPVMWLSRIFRVINLSIRSHLKIFRVRIDSWRDPSHLWTGKVNFEVVAFLRWCMYGVNKPLLFFSSWNRASHGGHIVQRSSAAFPDAGVRSCFDQPDHSTRQVLAIDASLVRSQAITEVVARGKEPAVSHRSRCVCFHSKQLSWTRWSCSSSKRFRPLTKLR